MGVNTPFGRAHSSLSDTEEDCALFDALDTAKSQIQAPSMEAQDFGTAMSSRWHPWRGRILKCVLLMRCQVNSDNADDPANLFGTSHRIPHDRRLGVRILNKIDVTQADPNTHGKARFTPLPEPR